MSDVDLSWRFSGPMADMSLCPTTQATERARGLAHEGVCDLSIGDVKFDTPEHIKQAAIRSIVENDTHYGSVQGSLALRAAVAAKFRRDNGLRYEPDEIVIGNGAGQLIFAALFATLSAGDEVIIPTPCWDNYADMVRLNRGVPRFVAAAAGAQPGAAEVIAAITPRTRWIILNNPNNPGGFVWPAEELARLAAALRRIGRGIAVIADETFERLCFGATPTLSFAALPGMRARTLTVNGLSKSHAMTGWRIGFAAGPKPLIEKITVFNANTTYSVCNAAQAAAVAGLADSEQNGKALAVLKAQIGASRFAALSRLSLVSTVSFTWPEAGYFVLVDVRQLLHPHFPGQPPSARPICDYLLAQARVAATDGAAFEAPGHIRLSFAGPETEIAAAYDRVVRTLISYPAGAFIAPAQALPRLRKARGLETAPGTAP